MTEVMIILGVIAVGYIILSGFGELRLRHDRVLEKARQDKFYQRLEEQELGKAKEAWNRGDIKKYEFHRENYNSLVAQHKEEQNKVLKGK